MTQPPSESKKEEAQAALQARVRDLGLRAPVLSKGSVQLRTGALDYQTRAEFIGVYSTELNARPNEPEAAVFMIANIVHTDDNTQRPICFAVNGGPGAASAFLNLGALGPKRVIISSDGTMPAPPYKAVENPDTWLEHFDLVFIDPPHTGFSTTAGDEVRKKMLSVDGDIDAIAASMRHWLTRNGRWDSPIYLAGESYGTTRAAGVANKLLDVGIALNGVILVSSAIDLQALEFAPRNDLPYALFLPAFACVAQFHGKLKGAGAQSAEAARDAAERFVADEYLTALHLGARLTEPDKARLADTISHLIGISADVVLEKNLRINDETFFIELLRGEGMIVGRLEARVKGPAAARRLASYEFDPGMDALWAPFAMANHEYLRSELGLDSHEQYDLFSSKVNEDWNWNRGKSHGNAFASTSDDLSKAMRRNRHMKVLFASGYYDLGTPYSATDWSIAQLDIPPLVRERVTHCYYEAGHMMYTSQVELEKLKRDIGSWLQHG